MPTTIAAGEFKAKCLKLLDKVIEERESLIITKRGKVVAHLIPPPSDKWVDPFGALRGSGTIIGDIISPLEDEWEANR
jgi:antitoxin (DNA-binding transcriptional repressor) of toxin-antitoxin stability system